MAFEFDANTAKADGEFDPTTATPVKPAGAIRKMADLGLSAAKGVIAVPEAAVGLADLATQGRAGKAVENAGVRFKDAKDVLTGFQSDDLKGKQQEFQQADGILAKAGVALSNPSLIANTVAESVPLMGAGAVPARAVMALAPKIGAMGAGAIGEGVAGAGSAGEQIRQETADGLLTGKQAALGAASGASTALFGAAGGKMAKKLGIGDVDTMLAKGSTEVTQVAGQQPKGAIRRMGEAAVSEGLLEELPQSVSEQALQNVALDRPVTQGLEDAAVMGTLSGGLMGAGAGAISRPAAQPVPPAVDVGGSAGQGLAGTEPAPTKSQAMGIDPAAGPMSAAAAMAVDSGAHETALQQAAQQAQETGEKAPESPRSEAQPVGQNDGQQTLLTESSQGQVQSGIPSANPTPANVNPATGEIISAYDQREADRPQALSTDILRVDGTPFTNIIQAKKAAREAGEGWAPFKLDKGVFVVRKQEATDAPAQNQSEAAAPAAPGATQSSADAVSEGGASADTPQAGALSAKTNPQPTTMGTQRNVTAGPGFSAKDVVKAQAPEQAPEPIIQPEGKGEATPALSDQLSSSEQKDNEPANVDAAAHQAATSPLNDKPEPTDGQKKAGNYPKGHTNIGGLDLAIENPAGSTRSGTDKNGKAWENTLQHHYGYIKGTIGNDKDHVDAFVKPGTPADHTGTVYVVDQIDPDTGKFDEHKVVIGAKNGMEARRIYQTNYAKGWKGMKAITPMPFDEFKTWVKDGPKNAPLSPDVAPVSSTTEKPSEPEANQTQQATSKREEAAKPSPDEPAAGPGVGNAGEGAAAKPTSLREAIERKQNEPTTHAGLKIYPIKIKVGDKIEQRWGVQTPRNAEREKNGERQIGGDPLSDTLDGAKKLAEQEVATAKDQQERSAAHDANAAAVQAKKDANKGKSLAERKRDFDLDKPTKLHPNAGLGTGTRRESMQKAVDQDRYIEAATVRDEAAKKRDTDLVERSHRANLPTGNINYPGVKEYFEAHARLKANKYEKPEYRVYDSAKTDGGFYEITKTEFDYAKSLEKADKAARQAAPNDMNEADANIQNGNATRELSSFMKNERDAATRSEKVAEWRKQYSGDHAETIAAGDISRSDYEKLADLVRRGGVTEQRAVEMIESSVSAGVLDRFVADNMKKKVAAQQGTPTHQDPGEKPEAATAPVIAQSLAKAARKEDHTQKEMRLWLLDEIDAAVKLTEDYPDYLKRIAESGKEAADSMYFKGKYALGLTTAPGNGMITFDVPGDGKFKVRNSLRGLMEFRAKVDAKSGTGFTDKPTKPKGLPATTGVAKGSSNQIEALSGMLEDLDFEAAVDYARETGISLNDAKISSEVREQFKTYLKDGTEPTPFLPSRYWEYPGQDGADKDGNPIRRATLTKQIGANEYQANVIGTNATGFKYNITKDGKSVHAMLTSNSFANTLKLAEDAINAIQPEVVKPKDTGWNMSGVGFAGKRYRGRNITLDDGREVVARIYENAGQYEDAEVKVDGVSKFSKTDRYKAEKLADDFIRTLMVKQPVNETQKAFEEEKQAKAQEEPGIDLMGFTRTPTGNGAFKLVDGNMMVMVEPTSYGFQAKQGSSAKSGPRLTEQQAIEWAANVRNESKAIQSKEAKPAQVKPDAAASVPKSVQDHVKWALTQLRDIEDALESVRRARGDGHILALEVKDQEAKQVRPNEILDEFREHAKKNGIDAEAVIDALGGVPDLARFSQPASGGNTEASQREFRNPDNLNVLHAPIEDKDWFKLKNGEEWQARQGYSGRGWSLVRNGNLHPEARNFDSQSDFIRSVVDVTSQTQAAGQVAAIDGDLRGYAYALVKNGQIITSGSFPSKANMEADDTANISNFKKEADAKGADIYIGGYPGADAWTSPDGLIFGMTFDELNAKQQKRTVPASLKGKMPTNAVVAYEGQAKPEEASDEPIPAVTEAQARKQFEWRNMGQKDGTKSHLLFFFESEKDKGTGAAMNRGEVSLYPGASGWKVEDGDGTSYKSLADAKKAAIDRAIPILQDQGYILKPAQAATAILDAANVTGKERIDALKDVKKGDITPDELQAAYPAKEDAEDSGRKSDEQNKKDHAESLEITRSAMVKLRETRALKDAAEKNSKEYGLAEIENRKALADVTRANVLGYPFTSGPEYQARVDNLDAALAHVKAAEDRVKEVFGDTQEAKPAAETDNTPVEQANAIEPVAADAVEDIPDADIDNDQKEKIGDFGRKVMVRKDEAQPTGQKMAKSTDERPAWARPYIVMQATDGRNAGKWRVMKLPKGEKSGAVMTTGRAVFDTEQEALNMIPMVEVARNHRAYPEKMDASSNWGIYRLLAEGKKRALVKGGFASSDEAMTYMAKNPVEIIEHKFKFPERPWLDKIERTGAPRRTKNVTKAMFEQTFAPGGVVYGNWLLNKDDTVNDDGQELSNQAFDALMDLAETLGVPPEALFLNGEMVLGLGADGKGGINSGAAHYSPDKGLINLTKINGAGSLAHEWWHSVDHYFAKSSGWKDSNSVVAFGFNASRTAARPELMAAIKSVIDAINYSKKSTTTDADMVRSNAQSRIDKSIKILDYKINQIRMYLVKPWKPGKKPATPEQLAQFDALADKLREGDQGEKVYMAPSAQALLRNKRALGYEIGSNIRDMNAIYKAVVGSSFLKSDPQSEGRQLVWPVEAIKDNKEKLEAKDDVTVEYKGRTDFYIEAREIDGFRSSNYWSTPHEMGARAFESYIFDKLTKGKQQSDYLVYAVENRYYAGLDMKPYPEGSEREAINKSFDELFKVIQTKETDKGVAMFSRGAQTQATAKVQPIVDAIKANWKNAPPIVVAFDLQDPRIPERVRQEDLKQRSGGAVGTPEGFFYKGTVYLMSSKVKTANDVARVLAHETLGHYGLRGMFGDTLTPILRQIAHMRKDQVRAKAIQYGLKGITDLDRRTAAEEVLAEMAQNTPEIGFVRRAIAAIRTWLRRNVPGFKSIGMTDDEIIRSYILPARRWVERGAKAEAATGMVPAFGRGDGEEPSKVFGREIAPLAMRAYKALSSEARNAVDGWNVNWSTGPLVKAFSGNTELADEIRTAFKPVQDKIRDIYGDTIPLHRGEMTRGEKSSEDSRTLYSWTPLPDLAKQYAMNWKGGLPKAITDDQIDAAVSQYERTGYVKFRGQSFARMKDNPEYFNIYDRDRQNLTDGDDLRDMLKSDQKSRDEWIEELRGRGNAYSANVPVDKLVWVPVGANLTQPEIIAEYNPRVHEADPVMFSRSVGETLKAITVTDIKARTGNKLADYRGLGLQFLGGRQIVDLYGKDLPQLGRYTQMVQQMSADANEVGAQADGIATGWSKLTDERQLAELMHDATLAQIDPAKEFVTGDNRLQWGKLNADYKALSPEAKTVYTQARDAYEEHYAQVREAIRDKIERSEMSSASKAAMLERMDGEFFDKIKGVYFPLARFGKYVVVTRGPAGVVNVSRAETLNEAEALRTQMRAAYPAADGFTVGKVIKDKEFNASRDSVGRGFLKELFGVLDEKGMGEELQDAVNQLYLASMPDLSWAKHGIHRKGTPGFSQDARRAFAQNMFHGARYLAKLRYADQLQDKLIGMQNYVESQANVEAFDSVKAQQVVDELNKRHDSLMNPKSNPLSTALTSFGFVFHMGLSPASAMVNLSGTAMVAYPIMGAKWGFDKAAGALLKAGKEAATHKNDISAALNGDEKRAYDAAVKAGTIDVTAAHDLAGIAQGEDAGVMWKMRPVMKWASFLFHHAERFNRQVTFVAAYRLARETGVRHEVAFEQATKATYDGHFDYASSNRPRVMQGNAAKVLLLFKQYGQNMVYTIARQAQLAMKAETPQERKEARKALGGLLVMHAAGAGVLGLPLVGTLLAAASMLGGSDDEPWDAEVALRNMLADAFGQKPAEVMARGFSRLTPWDISGRVGLDKLILPDIQEGLEGQRLGESAMAAALGPVAGIGINVLKGMQEISEGHMARGLESMMPAALRGPMKALRYEQEGAKDKTGVVIQDEVSLAGIAGQALGFNPSDVRNSTEGRSAIYNADKRLMQRRSELMRQFADAFMAKDQERVASVRQEIQAFNEKNPNRRIGGMQLMQSVRARNKRVDESQDGVYLPKKRRDAIEEGRFAVAD